MFISCFNNLPLAPNVSSSFEVVTMCSCSCERGGGDVMIAVIVGGGRTKSCISGGAAGGGGGGGCVF